jgi:hypothetical protein
MPGLRAVSSPGRARVGAIDAPERGQLEDIVAQPGDGSRGRRTIGLERVPAPLRARPAALGLAHIRLERQEPLDPVQRDLGSHQGQHLLRRRKSGGQGGWGESPDRTPLQSEDIACPSCRRGGILWRGRSRCRAVGHDAGRLLGCCMGSPDEWSRCGNIGKSQQ